MIRSRRKTRTWEDIIDFLMDIDARYMIRRYKKSPFLSIRDKQTDKQYSLKPIKAYENIDQVLAVARLIEHVGNTDWNIDMPILDQLEFLDNPNLEIEKETPLYSWSDIPALTAVGKAIAANKGINNLRIKKEGDIPL